MAWEQRRGGVFHIHATGSIEKDRFPQMLAAAGVDPCAPGLDIRTYIDDMPDCLAAADLVISRSGAMTLSELEASGAASVLIPSPNVAENHQYHNAMVLAEHDAAGGHRGKGPDPRAAERPGGGALRDPQTLRRLGRNAPGDGDHRRERTHLFGNHGALQGVIFAGDAKASPFTRICPFTRRDHAA